MGEAIGAMPKPDTKWVATRRCACGECRFTTREVCPEMHDDETSLDPEKDVVQLFRSEGRF